MGERSFDSFDSRKEKCFSALNPNVPYTLSHKSSWVICSHFIIVGYSDNDSSLRIPFTSLLFFLHTSVMIMLPNWATKLVISFALAIAWQLSSTIAELIHFRCYICYSVLHYFFPAQSALQMDCRSSIFIRIGQYEVPMIIFLLTAPDVTAIGSLAFSTRDVKHPYTDCWHYQYLGHQYIRCSQCQLEKAPLRWDQFKSA